MSDETVPDVFLCNVLDNSRITHMSILNQNPLPFFINGQYVSPTGRQTFGNINPANGTPNFDVDGNNEWLTDDYETYIRNNEEYYQMSCVLRSTTSAPTGVPTNAPTNAPTAVCNDQLNALCAQRHADGTFVHSGCAEAYRDQCDEWSCAAA